jgi:hypothetical protein
VFVGAIRIVQRGNIVMVRVVALNVFQTKIAKQMNYPCALPIDVCPVQPIISVAALPKD